MSVALDQYAHSELSTPGLDCEDWLEIKISINSEVSYTKVIFILIYKTQLVLIELLKISAWPHDKYFFAKNVIFQLLISVEVNHPPILC